MISESIFDTNITEDKLEFAKYHPSVFTNAEKLKKLYLQIGALSNEDYLKEQKRLDQLFKALAEAYDSALKNQETYAL